MEVWRKIEDFNNYEVSNYGRIRNAMNKKIRKLQKNRRGYWKVNLMNNGKSFKRTVSKLIARAFVPNQENLEYVTYKDGNKNNLNAENLRWISHEETTKIYLNRFWVVV